MIPEQSFVQVERDFTHPEAIPASNPISLNALLAPPPIYDTASDNNDSGDRAGGASALILIAGVPGAAAACIRRRRTLAVALGASTAAGLLIFWMLTSASDPLWSLPGWEPSWRASLPIQADGPSLPGSGLYGRPPRGPVIRALATVAGLLLARVADPGCPPIPLPGTPAPLRLVRIRHEPVRGACHRDRDGGRALTAFGEFTRAGGRRPSMTPCYRSWAGLRSPAEASAQST